jgi:hypothetical protein
MIAVKFGGSSQRIFWKGWNAGNQLHEISAVPDAG